MSLLLAPISIPVSIYLALWFHIYPFFIYLSIFSPMCSWSYLFQNFEKKIRKMSSGCQLRNFDFSFWAPFWSRGVHTLFKLKMIIALSSENVNLDFRKVLNPKILKTKSETWTRVVNYEISISRFQHNFEAGNFIHFQNKINDHI